VMERIARREREAHLWCARAKRLAQSPNLLY
jgi:hypothetical protein